MKQVPADELMIELEASMREHVGPVGRLVLRKKWRDLGMSQQAVDDSKAVILIRELESALQIIMGDDGASRAAARLREKLLDHGLDI